MERVDLRLPKPTLDLIDELAEEGGVDRSAMLRQIIDEGLPVVLRQKAAELEYRKLKQSISQTVLMSGSTNRTHKGMRLGSGNRESPNHEEH